MRDTQREKVVLGLSGGVDSSVAACLLREKGFEVLGLFLDIGDAGAREAAANAAGSLGIELEVCDIREELEEHVCGPFARAYLCGQTPNPCVMCNPAVKFRNLIRAADRRGARFIATGHYARAEQGRILRGLPANDQSYMLCRLLPEQAERLLLPLSGCEKKEVRRLAERYGLVNASRPDSMEICFIPDRDYAAWLAGRCPVPGPGPILWNGRQVGVHEGIHRWTVGQRLPGLYDGRKLYVSRIDAENSRIIADVWEELFTREDRKSVV